MGLIVVVSRYGLFGNSTRNNLAPEQFHDCKLVKLFLFHDYSPVLSVLLSAIL